MLLIVLCLWDCFRECLKIQFPKPNHQRTLHKILYLWFGHILPYSSSAYMRPSSLCRAWMFCCLSNTLLCNAFISWWLMLPPFAKRACDNIFWASVRALRSLLNSASRMERLLLFTGACWGGGVLGFVGLDTVLTGALCLTTGSLFEGTGVWDGT